MKTFNWAECKKRSHPETYALLEQSHDKPISEAEYIRQSLALPHNKLKTGSKRYAKRYQYLQKTFGFFQ